MGKEVIKKEEKKKKKEEEENSSFSSFVYSRGLTGCYNN
jgi:hypothetical protein